MRLKTPCNTILFICRNRTGTIRLLSMKMAMALLCRGNIEEKYRCSSIELGNLIDIFLFRYILIGNL